MTDTPEREIAYQTYINEVTPNGNTRLDNTQTDLAFQAGWSARATPMRCAECDCENGGADCNWIATPNPLDDPRVLALVEVLRAKTIMDPKNSNRTWLDDQAIAALSALEKNK